MHYYAFAPPPTVLAPPTILQPQSNESPILATNLYTPSSHFTLQVGDPCIIFPPKGLNGAPPNVGEPFDGEVWGPQKTSTVNIGLPSICAN